MLRKVLLLAVLLFGVPFLASAQDAPSGCAKADLDTALADYTKALAAIDTSKPDEVVSQLGALQDQMTSLRATCSGLAFNSDDEGMQPVLGPLKLGSGIWKASVETPGFFIASIETLSGDCEAGIMGFFNLMQGQAAKGADTIVKSDDCEMLVSISNTTDDWTMTFEQVSSS